ncbi:MAG TPA: hypothetical protein VH877_28305 [Polyangia bacterium]|jgi:hypothetical protein|nr:hypothetical protein [Polyangia bacterium]
MNRLMHITLSMALLGAPALAQTTTDGRSHGAAGATDPRTGSSGAAPESEQREQAAPIQNAEPTHDTPSIGSPETKIPPPPRPRPRQRRHEPRRHPVRARTPQTPAPPAPPPERQESDANQDGPGPVAPHVPGEVVPGQQP